MTLSRLRSSKCSIANRRPKAAGWQTRLRRTRDFRTRSDVLRWWKQACRIMTDLVEKGTPGKHRLDDRVVSKNLEQKL
jgi:hypothetical protein